MIRDLERDRVQRVAALEHALRQRLVQREHDAGRDADSELFHMIRRIAAEEFVDGDRPTFACW